MIRMMEKIMVEGLALLTAASMAAPGLAHPETAAAQAQELPAAASEAGPSLFAVPFSAAPDLPELFPQDFRSFLPSDFPADEMSIIFEAPSWNLMGALAAKLTISDPAIGTRMHAGSLFPEVKKRLVRRKPGKDGADSRRSPGIMQASALSELSDSEIIETVGPLFTEDQRRSGVLASVSLAQFILESGYGRSGLSQDANNLFGMKCILSGNTWPGSVWDGVSRYTNQTSEQNSDGSYTSIIADFRAYPCIEDSIADHSAYLLGAKKDGILRYEGLRGCMDYREAVQILKDGGYATSINYVQNLCSVIERWDLTRFDAEF